MFAAYGYHHYLVLDSDEKVWSVGQNERGELGQGHLRACYCLERVPDLPPIKQVLAGCGSQISGFLTAEGSIYICGTSNQQQLEYPFKPTLVPKLCVHKISMGTNHILVLDFDGVLWGQGSNDMGEFGIAPTPKLKEFTRLNFQPDDGDKIAHISCGRSFSLIVGNSGRGWGSGINDTYQLGQDHFSNVREFTILPLSNIHTCLAGVNFSLFLDGDGVVWTTWNCGIDVHPRGLAKIEGVPCIRSFGLGERFFIMVDYSGGAWGVGSNDNGQMSISEGDVNNFVTPTKIPNLPLITAVVCGPHHSLFLDTEGTPWKTRPNICHFKDENNLSSLKITCAFDSTTANQKKSARK